ncbi:Serine/threonine-protein kinase PknK [Zhongshania aliphaticivorans]|uniref:Serine/threonine-protein kinase PknK n=1 Tax=Zhongshania aliphaticivorans TaxID=1470434 RepID=A0A5S9NQ28_9GAMM|nr:LuxR C-terminal-related transcriptional regulator [Zhongshania aliphaticivorans]CAA0092533.1 Serine/threonine-protein kinase PknK [Zhongshania aliphaticivorans]CAA0109837.1 Serine/threonine-protein kinase PknK [Zhongshania aliphaticivorans]
MNTVGLTFSQFQILETKLKPPRIRAEALIRDQLAQRAVCDTTGTGLLTIVASAGSGKSTLMAELYSNAEKSNKLCCWLSLDEDDNECSLFSKYLIACIYSLDPKSALRELAFLKSNPSRDYGALFDSLLARIIAIKSEFVLFIDDFQHISNPEIIRFWNKLITHAPSTMCIVLAGRNRLPLDLSRRQISGMITEVKQNELNLNTDEIINYLKIAHNLECPPGAAETLHTSTEGWFAGVQLAALAISNSNESVAGFISGFTGKDKALTEYLLKTVLRGLSSEVREFLLLSSPLIRFSAKLCDHISQLGNGHEMLDYLDRNNIFIICEDREGVWFRYHHLFADFLRSELRKVNPAKYNEICINAAKWCENENMLTESVQYCLTAQNFEKAADLITARAPDLVLLQGDHYTVLDWMRRLPVEYHANSPQLLLNHAWSCAFSRDPDQAVDLCQKVLAGLEDSSLFLWSLSEEDKTECYWRAKATVAIAIVCADGLEKSIALCESALVAVPEMESFNISSIHNCLAYASLGQRNYAQSVLHAAEGYKFSIKAGSNYASLWAVFSATLANVEMGKLRAAFENATTASYKAGPADENNMYLCTMADVLNTEINVQKCNFNLAGRNSYSGRPFMSLYGPVELLLVAIRNEARQLAWSGKLDQARQVLRQGQDTALSTNQPRLHYSLIAEEIELQIWDNQIEAAKETIIRTNFFRDLEVGFPEELYPAMDELSKIVRARLLIADNQAELAFKTIVKLINLTQMKRRDSARLQYTLKTLKAVALWQLGKKKEGVRELDKVVKLASQEDHAYPIVISGRFVVPLLEDIRSKRSNVAQSDELKVKHDFVDRLLMLLTGGELEAANNNKSLAQDERCQELTGREIDILKLIGAGMANNEIAKELVLSTATVKWHLHNIYQKVEVRSRTAAAAYARNINLI